MSEAILNKKKPNQIQWIYFFNKFTNVLKYIKSTCNEYSMNIMVLLFNMNRGNKSASWNDKLDLEV